MLVAHWRLFLKFAAVTHRNRFNHHSPIWFQMDETHYSSQAGIFFACTENKAVVFEQVIPEHILMHVYSGRISLITADRTYTLSPGETGLFARNQLARLSKEPDGETPFRAVTVFLTQPFLERFYTALPLPPTRQKNPNALLFGPNSLLDDLFQSISGYSELAETFVADALALLKIQEVLTIVRTLDPQADALLGDFSEPHKRDLSGFMQQHFTFNISIPRFAYLTGRSLATFKRDFRKHFQTSPQKWLTEKRLGHAHFLIAEKQQRPSQAYIDAGFENYSHFTSTFKKHFGYSPSAVPVRS
jgi:AraC-like DNA-binding protein